MGVNVYDVGDAAPLTLTVDQADSSTVAMVEVQRPDGTTYPLAASPSPDRTEWTTALVLTAPGLWVTTWTVTGLGAGTERHQVSARPARPARTYATTGDLASFTGEAVPANAPRLLARATRLIDRVMVGALWDPVSEIDNRPQDARIAAAYRDAVCAQVGAWLEAGAGDPDADDADSDAAELAAFAAMAGASSMSFGSVSFGLKGAGSSSASSSSDAAQGPDFETVAPEALHELSTAGVYPPRIGLRR